MGDLVIAAPYYGSLLDSNQAISTLYFFAHPVDGTDQEYKTSLSGWNPSSGPELGAWLKKNGVTAVCCSASAPDVKEKLKKFDIKIFVHAASDLLAGTFSRSSIEEVMHLQATN